MRGLKLRSLVVGRNMRESLACMHACSNSLPIPVPNKRLEVAAHGGGQEHEREHSLEHGGE